MCLSSTGRWCLSSHSCRDQHANAHSNASDNEEELATKAINSPGSVEREDDTESSVEGVDQSDGVGAVEDLLVDDGAVRVECALTSDLLAAVDNHGDQYSLPDRLVLPQSRITTRDGFSLEFNGFTDGGDFLLDDLLGRTNASQRGARLFVVATLLNVPSG